MDWLRRSELYPTVEGMDGWTNEQLAVAAAAGNLDAAAQLLCQNEKFLTAGAIRLQRQYGLESDFDLDGLKQAGALALLEAASKFDPMLGVKLLSYAGGAIKAAMLEYVTEVALPPTIPKQRFVAIRKAQYFAYGKPVGSDGAGELAARVAAGMNISVQRAQRLLEDATCFTPPGDEELEKARYKTGHDAARAVYRKRMVEEALDVMETVLKPREQTLLSLYCGLAARRPLTFAEIAVRLNMNDASAAEKAYKKAVTRMCAELAKSNARHLMMAWRLLYSKERLKSCWRPDCLADCREDCPERKVRL